MVRPNYLSQYMFDWEILDVIVSGKSALDSKFFVGAIGDSTQVNKFLRGYGLDPNDPVSRAELFGNFQEALQFIRRYFLKEGNEEGLDLKIPNSLYMITDIGELFLMATGQKEGTLKEDELWAEIILKIMHTILHTDKDLRSNYFSAIQTQIFDKFYKFITRDADDNLYLCSDDEKIKLVDFETKSKKTRESVIIKLLHKAENVAEELFDRIGVRFITETKFDALRVVNFLVKQNIVIPHNVKPSRSVNTLVNLNTLRDKYQNVVKMSLRNDLAEDRFVNAVEREISECSVIEENERNSHSAKSYQAIQFTCRQLIKYKNPFLQEFHRLRKEAKASGENDLAKKILNLDVSLIARDIRFFYPFEVQVVDEKSHKENTEGEASHAEYKKAQARSAMLRVFGELIKYKNLEI
ncbi:TIGR04552 family protein [Halobacteriovorax sp. HLS]|uniref:TIGR04552 family protein n=1 Tax=Halobacteriovorax sp. HLS TaxID=2234000 RepID=UPI000FDC7E6A|nr:TIGR04552 family protein [Halobacteriovorax sp. HLS]